jgi:multidrug efflux pump subunit AcrA (membrane-fusion protein)
MNLSMKVLLAALVTGLATLSAIQAQEKKLKREELPPAVEKTVAEQSRGAAIRGFSTELEDGKRLYEIELVVSGHGKDISMDEHGNIVEVEEEVSIASLPSSVKDGFTKAAGSGTLGKVESITKNGKLVAYEAVVKTGTKSSEIQVGPDGKKPTHPK